MKGRLVVNELLLHINFCKQHFGKNGQYGQITQSATSYSRFVVKTDKNTEILLKFSTCLIAVFISETGDAFSCVRKFFSYPKTDTP